MPPRSQALYHRAEHDRVGGRGHVEPDPHLAPPLDPQLPETTPRGLRSASLAVAVAGPSGEGSRRRDRRVLMISTITDLMDGWPDISAETARGRKVERMLLESAREHLGNERVRAVMRGQTHVSPVV